MYQKLSSARLGRAHMALPAARRVVRIPPARFSLDIAAAIATGKVVSAVYNQKCSVGIVALVRAKWRTNNVPHSGEKRPGRERIESGASAGGRNLVRSILMVVLPSVTVMVGGSLVSRISVANSSSVTLTVVISGAADLTAILTERCLLERCWSGADALELTGGHFDNRLAVVFGMCDSCECECCLMIDGCCLGRVQGGLKQMSVMRRSEEAKSRKRSSKQQPEQEPQVALRKSLIAGALRQASSF